MPTDKLMALCPLAAHMANEETTLAILKEANRIVASINEEINNIQAMGKLDSRLNKQLNKIKRDTKQLVSDIRNKVFKQTSLDDWGGN
tara:strand:- start:943 stop:1206 length:264 start_codon:yes stop_codon:yes gene_type:complete